jgi:hypothetical protein
MRPFDKSQAISLAGRKATMNTQAISCRLGEQKTYATHNEIVVEVRVHAALGVHPADVLSAVWNSVLPLGPDFGRNRGCPTGDDLMSTCGRKVDELLS